MGWDTKAFAFNRSLKINDVIPYLEKDYSIVESNSIWTIKDIRNIILTRQPIERLRLLTCPWLSRDIYRLSRNSSITLNDMLSNTDIEWDMTALTMKDYHQYIHGMHNRYLDIVIAIAPLRLPVYVVLWILDFVDEYFWFECLYELTRIRMIENVMRFREKCHQITLNS
jgi:hypothetical protein